MKASVVCASCGARIRADRRLCLRCGEVLQSAPATSVDQPAGSMMSKGNIFMIGAVGSLTVLIVGAMWMQPKSTPRYDIARPVPDAVRAKAPTPSTGSQPREAAATTPAGLPAPMTALDSTRAAGAGAPSSDLQKARLRYEQALTTKPNDPEALNGLGQVMVQLGRLDDAAACFARAIETAPETWVYHFNLAHVEGQREKWEHAVAEYRVAARLVPRDYATQYNLAVALHKKGNDQAAIPEYERAIQLAPGEPNFHLSLAMSLEKIGRFADAGREYRQYLKLVPAAPGLEKLKAHIQTLGTVPTAERPIPVTVS